MEHNLALIYRLMLVQGLFDAKLRDLTNELDYLLKIRFFGGLGPYDHIWSLGPKITFLVITGL